MSIPLIAVSGADVDGGGGEGEEMPFGSSEETGGW